MSWSCCVSASIDARLRGTFGETIAHQQNPRRVCGGNGSIVAVSSAAGKQESCRPPEALAFSRAVPCRYGDSCHDCLDSERILPIAVCLRPHCERRTSLDPAGNLAAPPRAGGCSPHRDGPNRLASACTCVAHVQSRLLRERRSVRRSTRTASVAQTPARQGLIPQLAQRDALLQRCKNRSSSVRARHEEKT